MDFWREDAFWAGIQVSFTRAKCWCKKGARAVKILRILTFVSVVETFYPPHFYSLHGKIFQKIRTMLPDKPISALIKYYYTWKKLRFKTSVLDKPAKRIVDDRPKANGWVFFKLESRDRTNRYYINNARLLPVTLSSLHYQWRSLSLKSKVFLQFDVIFARVVRYRQNIIGSQSFTLFSVWNRMWTKSRTMILLRKIDLVRPRIASKTRPLPLPLTTARPPASPPPPRISLPATPSSTETRPLPTKTMTSGSALIVTRDVEAKIHSKSRPRRPK